MYAKEGELVGIYVYNASSGLGMITSNTSGEATVYDLRLGGATKRVVRLEDLEFYSIAEQVARRTAAEKRVIGRFSCGLCGGSIGSTDCGSKLDKCGLDMRVIRLGSVLKEFRERKLLSRA